MTITNSFLIEVAKSINSESYNAPGYLAVGTTDVATIETTDTALPGETYTRTAFIGSRTDTIVTLSSIKSGAVILSPTGTYWESSGVYASATSSTSDPLLTGITHSGILQTTNFDIDFIYSYEVVR